MGINDIVTLPQNDNSDLHTLVNPASYADNNKDGSTKKERKKPAAKKPVKADNTVMDNALPAQNNTALIKEKKNNRKRKAGNVDKESNAALDECKPKINRTSGKKSVEDQTQTAINKKPKSRQPAATEDAISDNNKQTTIPESGADKKTSQAKQQGKACHPKPVKLIPLDNDTIPDAHLSVRQSGDDNQEKKKPSKKNSRPNELVLTVISDINVTLKPHDCYVFKLNGYLQSASKSLVIHLFSEPEISCQRDLCALNWMVSYNDDKKALEVPVYNRGNKTQRILANEPIALFRILSPDSTVVLKP